MRAQLAHRLPKCNFARGSFRLCTVFYINIRIYRYIYKGIYIAICICILAEECSAAVIANGSNWILCKRVKGRLPAIAKAALDLFYNIIFLGSRDVTQCALTGQLLEAFNAAGDDREEGEGATYQTLVNHKSSAAQLSCLVRSCSGAANCPNRRQTHTHTHTDRER